MKKNIYVLILLLVLVSGLVFSFAPFAYGSDANREINNGTKTSSKSLSIADTKSRMADERKKWEASPDGRNYKAWEISPEGKKVHASHDKIRRYLKTFSTMEAVVTSVTFERENAKSGPKWLIVRIEGEDYMMQFSRKDFQKFNSLKVNDKIIVRSRSAGYSHNHPYLIVSGDYIEHNSKVLFKRDFNNKKGC